MIKAIIEWVIVQIALWKLARCNDVESSSGRAFKAELKNSAGAYTFIGVLE